VRGLGPTRIIAQKNHLRKSICQTMKIMSKFSHFSKGG